MLTSETQKLGTASAKWEDRKLDFISVISLDGKIAWTTFYSDDKPSVCHELNYHLTTYLLLLGILSRLFCYPGLSLFCHSGRSRSLKPILEDDFSFLATVSHFYQKSIAQIFMPKSFQNSCLSLAFQQWQKRVISSPVKGFQYALNARSSWEKNFRLLPNPVFFITN